MHSLDIFKLNIDWITEVQTSQFNCLNTGEEKLERLMPGVVCLHDDVCDDNFITFREINSHGGGVQIDEVQLEDQVGAELDLQDFQLGAEGVQPEPGVQLAQPVLAALTVQSPGGGLEVTEQGQGHGLLQAGQHQAGAPPHHHWLGLTAGLSQSYSWRLGC